MNRIFITLLMVCTVSCSPSAQPDRRQNQHSPNEFPDNIYFVQDLGNGWFIYKMEIFGETRYYKAREDYDSVSDCNWALQAITEIRPPNQYGG